MEIEPEGVGVLGAEVGLEADGGGGVRAFT